MNTRTRALTVLAGVLAWLTVALCVWGPHGARYDWDEVDYVTAAAAGPLANMLDRGSLSIGEFVEFVKAKQAHRPITLPNGYDEEHDPLVLRHYHPPFVPWLVSLIGHPRNERLSRAAQLLGAGALIAQALIGYSVLAGSEITVIGVLLTAALSAWLSVLVFANLFFHGWESVWALGLSWALLKTCETPGSESTRSGALRWRLLAAAFVSGAALTLESGALVAAGGVAAMAYHRRWRDIGLISACTIAFVLCFWPAALLKGSIFKIAAFYAYRVRLGHEYSSTISYGRLAIGFSPFLGAILASGAWIIAARGRAERARALPFIAIGSAYLVAMIRFVLDPIYIAPGLAPFIPLAGLAATRAWLTLREPGDRPRFQARPAAFAAALVVALATTICLSWRFFSDLDWFLSDRKDADWAELKKTLTGRDAFIDGGHVFAFYLSSEPGVGSIRKITQGYDHVSLLVRERGQYRDLTRDDIAGRIVAPQASHSLDWPKLEAGLLAGCPRSDILGLHLYTCPR